MSQSWERAPNLRLCVRSPSAEQTRSQHVAGVGALCQTPGGNSSSRIGVLFRATTTLNRGVAHPRAGGCAITKEESDARRFHPHNTPSRRRTSAAVAALVLTPSTALAAPAKPKPKPKPIAPYITYKLSDVQIS